MASIWEVARNAYNKAFWFSLWFTLFSTLISTTVLMALKSAGYPISLDLPALQFSTATLQKAISLFQKGTVINVLAGLGMIIVAIVSLLAEVLVNAILLVNYFINLFLTVILLMLGLPGETINTLAGILAWIVEAPLVLGLAIEIGQVVYQYLIRRI